MDKNQKRTIAYARLTDIQKITDWIKANQVQQVGSEFREPFYTANKETIDIMENKLVEEMPDEEKRFNFKNYYRLDRNYAMAYGWKLDARRNRKDAENVCAMCSTAFEEGQPLSVYAIMNRLCLCGYGATFTVLPCNILDIVMFKDYTEMTAGEMLRFSGGTLPSESEAALATDMSMAGIVQAKTGIMEQRSALEKQKDAISAGDVPELAEIKAKINALQAEMNEKTAALLQTQNALLAEANKKIDELNRQIFILDTQIYGIRCRTGEVIHFSQLLGGEPCDNTEPILVYQKVRFIEDEMSRYLSMNMGQQDISEYKEGFMTVLKHRSDIRDLFVPDRKCIAVIKLSSTGKILSRDERYGNMQDMLKQYDVSHGRQVAILVRNGQQLYIGWTDDEKVVLDNDQVFLTPGKSEIAQEDAETACATSRDVRISRFFILNLIQGIIDNGRLLQIPEKEQLFLGGGKYVRFSSADGAIEDNRYGTFEEMLARSKDIPLKEGDHIMSVVTIRGIDDENKNKDGRGHNNRTHDCVLEKGKLYPINLIDYDAQIEVEVAKYPAKHVPSRTRDGVWRELHDGRKAYMLERAEGAPIETWKAVVTYPAENIHDWKLIDPWKGGLRKIPEERLLDWAYHAEWRLKGYGSFNDSIKDYYFYMDTFGDESQMRCQYNDGRMGLEQIENTGPFFMCEYIHAKLAGQVPNYYVSLPMNRKRWSWSDQTTATNAKANMLISHDKLLSPTYLCGTWLRYVIITRHTGTVERADAQLSYTELLPFLNRLLEFIDKREVLERRLLTDVGLGSWLERHAEDWDVILLEWRIKNRKRSLTPAGAKQFAKFLGERT